MKLYSIVYSSAEFTVIVSTYATTLYTNRYKYFTHCTLTKNNGSVNLMCHYTPNEVEAIFSHNMILEKAEELFNLKKHLKIS